MPDSRSTPIPVAQPRNRKPKAAGSSEAGPEPRTSSYQGLTRAAAAKAYHADAIVMARMGFAPTSETWSTELQHVLVVEYRHAPGDTAAVLTAVAEAESESIVEPPEPVADGRNAWFREWLLSHPIPLGARIGIGAVAGLSIAIALCLLLGAGAGEAPDTITLGGFGLLGLVLGLIAGATRD